MARSLGRNEGSVGVSSACRSRACFRFPRGVSSPLPPRCRAPGRPAPEQAPASAIQRFYLRGSRLTDGVSVVGRPWLLPAGQLFDRRSFGCRPSNAFTCGAVVCPTEFRLSAVGRQRPHPHRLSKNRPGILMPAPLHFSRAMPAHSGCPMRPKSLFSIKAYRSLAESLNWASISCNPSKLRGVPSDGGRSPLIFCR